MILDTSFLIDVLRGRTELDKLEELDRSGDFRTTSISVMELWEGIARSGASEKEKEKVGELLEEIESLGFNGKEGKKAGEINYHLKKEGQRIDLEDVMIASIAIENSEPVITRNIENFERIEDVKTETYRRK